MREGEAHQANDMTKAELQIIKAYIDAKVAYDLASHEQGVYHNEDATTPSERDAFYKAEAALEKLLEDDDVD